MLFDFQADLLDVLVRLLQQIPIERRTQHKEERCDRKQKVRHNENGSKKDGMNQVVRINLAKNGTMGSPRFSVTSGVPWSSAKKKKIRHERIARKQERRFDEKDDTRSRKLALAGYFIRKTHIPRSGIERQKCVCPRTTRESEK